jgi:hypothetical protein
MSNAELRIYARRALEISKLASEFSDPGKLTPEEQHCHDCEMEIFRQWLAEHPAGNYTISPPWASI